MSAYGYCAVCGAVRALLVQTGRVRHHLTNGKRCQGSLEPPSAPARKDDQR